MVWPLVSVGSLLVLVGSAGNRTMFIVGIGVILVAFVIAAYMALSGRQGPKQAAGLLVIAGFSTIYVVSAVVAGITLGWAYAVAAVLAGLIPLTAFALIAATARAKTEASPDGLRDRAAEADDDPYPGIGLDDSTPLGDSPELSGHGSRRHG